MGLFKRHPRTGEPRETEQPLKIDRLPPIVHRAIQELHGIHGLTWAEIEALSAQPFGQKWDDVEIFNKKGDVVGTATPPFEVHPARGFVPWDKLEPEVRALFPEKKLPKSTLHRWFDLRISQVQEQIRAESIRSRELAHTFAELSKDLRSKTVIAAAQSTIFRMMQDNSSEAGQRATAKALVDLAMVIQDERKNELKERQIVVGEKTLQMKIDEMERKARELVKDADKTADGAPALTREQVIDRVKEIYGVK